MLAAAQLGDCVGIVNLIGALAPQLRRNFRNYRLDGVVGPIVRVEAGLRDVMAAYADPARLVDAFTVAARRASAEATVIGPGEGTLNVFLADQGADPRGRRAGPGLARGPARRAGSTQRRCTSVSSGPSRSPGLVTGLRATWRRPSRSPSRFAIRPGSGDATISSPPCLGMAGRHRATCANASRNTSTTRSCWETDIPGKIGRERISSASRSAMGRNRRQAPGARMVVTG